MKHSVDAELRSMVAALRTRWAGLRLVSGGTDQPCEPRWGRLSPIPADAILLMVALRPGLRYRRDDGGWHRLGRDEVFVMRPGQWQERDVARGYDQLKLACRPRALELVRNRDDVKTGLTLPAPEPRRWTQLMALATHGDELQRHAAWALLLAEFERALAAPASYPAAGARRFHLLCDHLREHLDQEHSRESLAAVVGCHPAHVSRLFRQHADCSYGHWLEAERLALAKELLTGTDLGLEAIAGRCGFSSANYLVRRFRAAVGVTPGVWRRDAGKAGRG